MTAMRVLTSRTAQGLASVLLGSVLVAATALGPSQGLHAQSRPLALSFTEAQAQRGRASYAQHCASCHGAGLDDGAYAPTLKGTDFRQKWGSDSPEALFTYTSAKMPPAGPGTLGDVGYAELLAYVLGENGVKAGAVELPAQPEALRAMVFPGWPRGGGGLAPGAKVPPGPVRVNPLDAVRPVTAEMLVTPPQGDWLTWRRTYDAYGYSPLTTIGRANVGGLRVAWTWSLPTGPSQAPPLVHDGVLFVFGFGDRVQALDAANGDLLWQYTRRLPQGVAASVKRGLSLYGNRLYMPTSDAHVVALDVKTGRVMWDQPIADPAAGYRLTGGTLVAKGKVMVGTTGRAAGGNMIVGLDAATGAIAWRFHTIGQPGEPGGNSWNGTPLDKRNGGSVWIPGSYDPVQNLAFFGPGNTYDTAPLRNSINQPGITNDGLYLDSTLAINPDTGKLVWHYQHQQNGQWDLDYAFERQVVQLRVKDVLQTVVVTVGKQAIFDFVDVESGQYRTSIDLGLQNLVTAIDPKTGAKIVDQTLVPGDGQTKMVCPHVSGGRGWIPTAFDPTSKVVYVPMTEACMDLVPVPEGERGSLSTGVRWTVRPRPESDGNYGRLQAVNLESGRTLWVARQRAPLMAGTLVTAGGLVFVGSLDRMFSAHDSATGAVLWQARLNDVPSAPPITYTVKGRQYVAAMVGPGGYQSTSYSTLVPEIQNPPDHSAALWVFELPAASMPSGAAAGGR